MPWISKDMVAETWARGTSLTAGQPFSWPQGWSTDWKKHYSSTNLDPGRDCSAILSPENLIQLTQPKPKCLSVCMCQRCGLLSCSITQSISLEGLTTKQLFSTSSTKMIMSVCVQLPVWPATVDRLSSPILYSVHGCSCRNASSPEITPIYSIAKIYIYTGAQSFCATATSPTDSKVSAIMSLRKSSFVPPRGVTSTTAEADWGWEAWSCYHDFTRQAALRDSDRDSWG